jgi:hypothetical protein
MAQYLIRDSKGTRWVDAPDPDQLTDSVERVVSSASVEQPQDIYPPWFSNVGGTIGVPSVTGGLGTRWVPSRDTSFYGVTVNITASAGNVCISLYDENLNRLATSGSVASPGTGLHMLHLPAGGVAVREGKTYWIDLAANDTATLRFAAWTQTTNVIGTRSVAYQRGASGSFPAPAQLLPLAHGVSIGTPGSGVALTPVTDPPRTAKPVTAPFTMGVGVGGQVLARDPSTGRLFAGTAGNALAYSDDNGTTWTTTTFSDGFAISAITVVGSSLLIATDTKATPAVGAIYKGSLAGPYTNAGFPATLTGQEGACRPWNLVAYSDGTVFAGNYDSNGNGSSQVRIRRSTDSGSTWSIVMDLGPADGSLRHVHSVARHPDSTSLVVANIGDSGAVSGVYKSTDGGATFARVATFGAMRLTPVIPLSDGGFLWLSDQYRMGGNLHYMDGAATKLQPRSHYDAPWNGDGYAMTLTKDSAGRLYYACWYTNTTYTRTALFVTADEGDTSYLVADRGGAPGYGTALTRAAGYLFYENQRYDVSGLALA